MEPWLLKGEEEKSGHTGVQAHLSSKTNVTLSSSMGIGLVKENRCRSCTWYTGWPAGEAFEVLQRAKKTDTQGKGGAADRHYTRSHRASFASGPVSFSISVPDPY